MHKNKQTHTYTNTHSGDDPRGRLVLDLLLDTAEGPAPNFAHMLLGFDFLHGPEGVGQTLLDPWSTFSCLRVIVDAINTAPHKLGIVEQV